MFDWRTLLSVLAVPFVLISCSHKMGKVDLDCGHDLTVEFPISDHIFEIDSRGRVLDDNGKSDGGTGRNFKPQFKKIAKALEKYQKCRVQPGSKAHVLLFFHGGLNTSNTARKRASEQAKGMLEDGYFPIFGVWDTGPFTTYWEQIAHVRNGHYEKYEFNFRRPQTINDSILNATLTAAYVVGDVLSGFARAPTTFQYQLGRWWNSRALSAHKLSYMMSEDECLRLPGSRPTKYPGTIDCQEDEHHKEPWQKNLVTGPTADASPSPLRPDSYWYTVATPLRFVTIAPADSIGTTAWENMVRRTRTSIHRPKEFNTHIPEGSLWYIPKKWAQGKIDEISENHKFVEEQSKQFPKGMGGFAKFFSMLETCGRTDVPPDIKTTKSTKGPLKCDSNFITASERTAVKNIDLTLIGHSMGAIVLNEIIPLFPKLPYRNIVYMAAAASIRDTKRSIEPLLEKPDNKAKFYSLMLHPQNDAREIAVKGALPSGSLLAWIDEMYDDPRTMLDRTFGSWRNARTANHLFPMEAQRHMRFRVFDWNPYVGKAECGKAPETPPPYPTTHGGFSDCHMRYWCPVFWGVKDSGSAWMMEQNKLWPDKSFNVCVNRS